MKTAIIIAVLLLLGLGGFFLGTKLVTPQQPASNPTPAVQVTAPANSLVGLLSSTKSVKCTFDNDGDKGTAYISGGIARIELNATFDDGKYKDLYHMIDNGTLVYIWKNDDKGGVVTKSEVLLTNSALPTPNDGGIPLTTGGFNSDVDYHYTCEEDNPQTSLFLVPTDVTFTRSGLPQPSQ